MPAYLHIAEPQEIRQEEERRKQLREELEKCTLVKGTFRNKIYRFLADSGIHHLTEIDYPLRKNFQAYAKQNFLKKQQNVMINAFDRIRQQAVWEEQKTLAGRQKYKLKYENALIFLKYLPDREIAEKYTTAREESYLLWDFRISCPETLKQQVFRGVCSISREKPDSWERKVALTGLQYLYRFCIRLGISDVEMMELEEKEQFKEELKKQFRLPAFPLLHLASWATDLRYGWNFREASPLKQVKKCQLPMLFIHGTEDTFVPTWMGDTLFAAKPGIKEYWRVEGAEHAVSYLKYPKEYTERVKNFLEKYNNPTDMNNLPSRQKRPAS